MADAKRIRTRITLNYGPGKGSFSYAGLLPECTDEQAYVTGTAINTVQADTMLFLLKTEESRLTRN